MPADAVFPFILVMTLALGGFGVLLARGPLGRALARRIEGTRADPEDLAARLVELEQRLAESDLDRRRLAELEERVDFAERLLAGGNTHPPMEIR
jgi:hypothetical protein